MRDYQLLRQQVAALRRRLDELDHEAETAWPEISPEVRATLEELGAALEELQISREELQVANAALAAAREEVEHERQRYRDLFHAAPDAYLVTDPDGTIREANRAAGKLFGVRHDRLAGKPLSLLVAEEDRRRFRSCVLRFATAEPSEPARHELALRPRAGRGSTPAALTVGVVRDGTGHPVQLRWLIRDLSERRQAEEQAGALAVERLARAQAEATNQAKADFLAVMSHELRTPLTAIMGYAELLQMGVPEPVPPAARAQVERIDQAARHLLQLIDEILTYSRLEAQREEVNGEAVDLGELVQETVAFIEPLAARKQLALGLVLPQPAPVVQTDPGKLRQIVANLLFNAVKFTPAGEIRVELEAGADEVRLHVADTGIGIAPENLERVFEPFWQEQQGTTRAVGGTGLGLAVASRMARLLGGELRVQSTPDVGTTFTLRLPLD